MAKCGTKACTKKPALDAGRRNRRQQGDQNVTRLSAVWQGCHKMVLRGPRLVSSRDFEPVHVAAVPSEHKPRCLFRQPIGAKHLSSGVARESVDRPGARMKPRREKRFFEEVRVKAWIMAVCAALPVSPAQAQSPPPPDHAHHNAKNTAPLTAPGNDAFAAIQEVVDKLLADPNTDWRRVNLEALRQHLIDMHNFTLNVEVTAQKPIDGGIEFTVKPTTPSAAPSLARLLSAHPAVLQQESGWTMTAVKNSDGGYTARVLGRSAEDTAKIRGLGYIGIVAYGNHHPAHHWQMATGRDPHPGH